MCLNLRSIQIFRRIMSLSAPQASREPNPPPGRSTADSRSRLPSKNIPSHPKRTNRPDNIRHKCSRRIPSRFLRYRLNSGKRDAAGFVLFPVYAIFAKITFARTGRIPETRNRIVQGIRAVLTQNKKFSHEKTIPNPVCRSPVLSDIQATDACTNFIITRGASSDAR